jgi:hypothetical protein
MLGLTVQNFVSAATGMAVLIALIRGIVRHTAKGIGNFWADLTRSTLYVLILLSLVVALILVSQGVVQQSKQSPRISAIEPHDADPQNRPDRIIPILNAWGLVGEIQIWHGESMNLPAEDSFLFQNFASQAARAFERAQALIAEQNIAHVSQTQA